MMQTDANPGPVNLGNPIEMTVREIAELVLELTDSASPIVNRPLPADDPTRRRPDITRARTVLQWEPRVPPRVGLAEAIAYYRSRLRRLEVAAPSVREPDRGGVLPLPDPGLHQRAPQR